MIDLQDDEKKIYDFKPLRQDLERRLAEMRTIREPYLCKWKDNADHLSPERGAWIQDPNKTDHADDSDRPWICDDVPTKALYDLASGMHGGLTSQTRKWFNLTTEDKELDDFPKVKDWLEVVEQFSQTSLHKSNFYQSILTYYHDLALFGTAVMLIHEDSEDVVRFHNIPAGQYFLAEDERQEIAVLYREFNMTVYALVREYGLENCSDAVKDFYRNRVLEKEIKVVQAIQRKSDFDEKLTKKAKNDPNEYIDVHWECGNNADKALRYRGYREQPFSVSKWFDQGVYGTSPTDVILCAIKELYHLKTRLSQGIDKAMHPQMILDEFLFKQKSSVLAGGVLKSNSTAMKQPAMPLYPNPPQFERLEKPILDARRRIQEAYYTHLFMMLSQMEGVQPRNQMEIIERKGEKITMLSPVLQNVHRGAHKVVIDRLIKIGLRYKLVPPIPQELSEKNIEPEYISDLAMAQKAVETTGIEQYASFAGNLMQAFPEIRHKVKPFGMMNVYGNSLGLPPSVSRSDDEAQELLTAENQRMEQQQQVQQGMQTAQGAKLLSETDVGGGKTALTEMLSSGGGV